MTTKIRTKMEVHRLGSLRLLDEGRNARFMRSDQFRRLVENLRTDGALTSVPFAVYDRGPDEPPLVLSGNHRVMAAIEAFGRDVEVDVMVTYDDVSDQRALALQLSHNAISGQDDPALLRALFEELEDIDWREYAGLDDKTLDLMADVEIGSLSEANLTYQTVTLMFLPEERDRAIESITEATAIASGASDLWMAPLAMWEELLEALDVVASAHDVKNTATAFRLLLDLTWQHVTDLAEGWFDDENVVVRHKGWVPTATVVGMKMPSEAAGVVKQAVDRIAGREGLSPWQAMEFMAAEYLAGE